LKKILRRKDARDLEGELEGKKDTEPEEEKIG